jgi:hypothetical protein
MITIKPYNPPSTRETSHKDALSARAIHDIANGCNAFKAYMPRVILNEVYSVFSCPASINETIIKYFTGRLMPGWRRVSARIVHATESGYSHPAWSFYASAGIFDPTTNKLALGDDYVADQTVARHEWESASTSFAVELFSLRTEGIIGDNKLGWFYLSVASTDASDAMGKIQAITLWQSGVIE